jgi:hypothetical protein
MPNPGSNSNWLVNSQPWSGSGGNVVGGGGDPVAPAGAASRLDRLRMGDGQLPDAQYPDGYLGSVNGRQQGKQDDQLRTRLGDRAYQRGVHKDTKMSPDQYQWPVDFSPMSGLENQARGRRSGNVIMTPRFVSTGDPTERYNAGMEMSDAEMQAVYQRYGVNPRTAQATDTVDPARRAVMSHMLPPYSAGV